MQGPFAFGTKLTLLWLKWPSFVVLFCGSYPCGLLA